jgi:hypothetical protein
MRTIVFGLLACLGGTLSAIAIAQTETPASDQPAPSSEIITKEVRISCKIPAAYFAAVQDAGEKVRIQESPTLSEGQKACVLKILDHLHAQVAK